MTQQLVNWEERRDSDVARGARSAFERDYARVVHSAAFRRLQGKTQVLGVGDSDFYRTRLTHSMEVSQIGEGIVRSLKRRTDKAAPSYAILPDSVLMRTICLAHDLGHPPFGHGGEVALNRCMVNHGGFEGNGHTLRIMSRLEQYHASHGMNLSRRTLLGVVKYPAPYSNLVNIDAYDDHKEPNSSIFRAKSFKPPKCYLDTEDGVVSWLAKGLEDWEKVSKDLKEKEEGVHRKTKHRSLDTSIMEIADDISYGIHDLEDAIQLQLIDREEFRNAISSKDLRPFRDWEHGRTYEQLEKELFSKEAHLRKKAIGALVDFCVRNTNLDTSNPHGFQHKIFANQAILDSNAHTVLKSLQRLVVQKVIQSTTVQQLEFKGQKIVTELFNAFNTDPERLLPPSSVSRWKKCDDDSARSRVICDYVAGMTDEYAVKRFEQLFSPRVGSVFDKF